MNSGRIYEQDAAVISKDMKRGALILALTRVWTLDLCGLRCISFDPIQILLLSGKVLNGLKRTID
jgi:hypothetical protein